LTLEAAARKPVGPTSPPEATTPGPIARAIRRKKFRDKEFGRIASPRGA
jgi:hypothetical protein